MTKKIIPSESTTKTITLDVPLKCGGADGPDITEITLFKPAGTGWLRGVKLFDLIQLDTAALTTVLPRITDPALTEAEIRTRLDPADFLKLGAEVSGFLVTSSEPANDGPRE
ncbi:MAG: phage tail assembly protein [Candidatus Accumulibacter sp.]|jgi:hypothetical protein|nr:phage tail assembly protein [Accumulibacter sp.]